MATKTGLSIKHVGENEYLFQSLTYGKVMVLAHALEPRARLEHGNGLSHDLYTACYNALLPDDRVGFFNPFA